MRLFCYIVHEMLARMSAATDSKTESSVKALVRRARYVKGFILHRCVRVSAASWGFFNVAYRYRDLRLAVPQRLMEIKLVMKLPKE